MGARREKGEEGERERGRGGGEREGERGKGLPRKLGTSATTLLEDQPGELQAKRHLNALAHIPVCTHTSALLM